MVAIISGLGLGISTSSLANGNGTSANASTGRSAEQVYVNSATGNLVLCDTDERLSAIGLDLALVRTYNSQGLLNDDNGDNWRLGVHEKVYGLTGTVNTAGSTVRKVFGDGADVLYTYNATLGRYVATDGDGAHDTLAYNSTSAQWTWTDGSSRNTETYNSSGQLLSAKDTDGNTVSYTYTGSLLTRITTAASGTVTQNVYLDYSGNNLTQIRTVEVNNGVTTTQTVTRYYYDILNRLSQVMVDLTPADNTVTLQDNNLDSVYDTVNGQTYVTWYTYDGLSARVASINQGDGTSVSFAYQSLDGQYRVRSYTITNAEGNRTTRFAYSSYSAGNGVYQSVSVTDPLNGVTTYSQDTAGRLTSVLSPTINSTVRLETRYSYDAAGNLLTVTEDPTGLNRVTTMSYDGNGNLLSTRDSAGNTVTRTYSATNQLLSETTYLVRDPDGAGAGQPNAPLTTRYAYDSEEHLRYVISPDGRVTEHRYNPVGSRVMTLRYRTNLYTGATWTLADMDAWATTQKSLSNFLTQLERVDYAYDFRGEVSTMTAWSALTTWTATDGSNSGTTGTSAITRLVYDQRGRLLQTIEPRGEATTSDANDYKTTYTYDGLGRILTSVEWVANGVTRTTTNQYDDVGNRTVTTLANGLVTTSTYNRAGDLTSVINTGPNSAALGTTTYKYDTNGRLKMVTDPTGLGAVIVYDEAGRKVGEVDHDASLTEWVYNGAGQVIKTIRYAIQIDILTYSSLFDISGNPTNVGIATLRAGVQGNAANDRIARNVYNNAGQLQYTIDEAGAVTESVYDGAGRITDTIRYANTVTLARSIDQVLPGSFTITTSANDRRTRYFYNNDGLLLGTLDAAGYLVENVYDNTGHLARTIAYANPTPTSNASNSTLRLTGALTDLRPPVDNETSTDPEQDATTYFFYDGQGRKVGELDAEGYLTETVYGVDSRVTQQIRYDRVLTYTAGSSTFQTLKSAASGAVTRKITYVYDGVGRLSQETDHEGTVTTYVYDGDDNLISSTRALGTTDARTTQTRYDALGRVTQELSGEGSKALAALVNPTQAQIDAVWTQYGVRHTYDLAGRRTTTTDAAGNVTRFYYDQDSRLRFTINALGEVTESRYNALGQLTDTLAYSNRISTSGLTGGVLGATTASSLTPGASTNDARTTYTYALTGQIASATTAEAASLNVANTTYLYNAFGEERSRTESIDATRTRTTDSTYDTRGLLTLTRRDTAGLNVSESRTYDAFGRLSTLTDARGNVVSRPRYDRLGRQIATRDVFNYGHDTTYDAFSRVKTVTDAYGYQTTYTYNDSTRTVTVQTPEGVSVTTVHNRHGQDLTVTAAGNTTTYSYNANGALVGVSDNLGPLELRVYDNAGRELREMNALGIVTSFTYDAANRVLTRTVDPKTVLTANDNPNGLALVTSYVYDGQGRVTDVTEPNGRLTRTTYDKDGRITQVAIDPNGLNLRTQYTHDLENHTLTVTEGAGSSVPRRTQYLYDTLGRRIEEILDPTSLGGTLNLRTQYKYDANGNMTRKIDARGNSTWYIYDTKNRMTFTVDALGDVTGMLYDSEDRHYSTRRYYSAISTSGFGDVVTLVSAPVNNADQIDLTLYDKDGRAVYSVNGMGTVTQRTFDAAGRVTRTRTYGIPITPAVYPLASLVTSALTTVGNDTANLSLADRVDFTAYDVRGRVAFTMDGAGGTVQFQYDASGNVTTRTAFAAIRSILDPTDLAGFTSFASANAANAQNQTTRYWYDTNDRLRFTLDPEGYLTETRYDDVARQQTDIRYAAKPTIAANATLANVVTAASGIANASNDRTIVSLADAGGRLIRITDAEGYRVEYQYDACGNRILMQQALNTAATNWSISRSYFDAANREVFTTTGENYLTAYTYNAVGNRISRIQYDTRIAPPSSGMPTPASGDTGHVTHYTYDNANRLARESRELLTYNRAVTSYVIPSGATWATVATAVYGTTNVDDELQRALGNPALTAGATLTNFPATLTDVIQTDFQYDARGNRTAVIDAAGSADARTTTYRYDTASRLYETVDAKGTVTHMTLDAFGNVSVRYNAYNAADQRTTQFWYDGENRVLLASDALQVVTLTQYDAFGNLTTRTEDVYGTQRVESFTYDRNNNQLTATNGAGEKTEYRYDAAGNRTQVINANAVALTTLDDVYYRDFRKRLGVIDTTTNQGKTVAQLTAVDKALLTTACTTNYAYDRDNRLITVTDLIGTVTRYTYDGADNKLTTTQASGLGAQQRLTTYTYDKDNRVLTVTDPINGLTSYIYDVFGNQIRITNANGGIRNNTFDKLGRLNTSILTGAGLTNSGLKTVNTYDRRNNILSTTTSYGDNTDARVTSYQYDQLDQLTRITDGEGFSTNIVYDKFGNQKTITTGLYLLTSGQAGYDATKAGRAFSLVTTYTFDAVNHTKTMTDALNNVTRYDYNNYGERTGVTESATGLNSADARTTSYGYDGAGRLNRVQTPLGGVTSYTYDKVGNKITERVLQSGTEASGVWINKGFEYDKNSRLTAEIDPYGTRTEHGYDAVGNETQTRYAVGTSDARTTNQEYDLNNRKTADIDALNYRTSYQYDKLGNRIKVTDALNRVARYYFDAANRLTTVLGPAQQVNVAQTVMTGGVINTFKYDSAGNRVEERVWMTPFTGTPSDTAAPAPTSSNTDRRTVLAYDKANRLASKTEPTTARTDYVYNGAGLKTKEILYANAALARTQSYTYDTAGRVSTFTDVDGTVTTFTYDGANNRLTETITDVTDSRNPIRKTVYTYDLNNRRITETFDPTGLNIVKYMKYDQVGNLLETKGAPDYELYAAALGGQRVERATYDLNNHQITFTQGFTTGDGDIDPSGGQFYQFGLLPGLANIAITTKYGYDRIGNRTSVTDARGNVTNYVYDLDNRQIQEIKPLAATYTRLGGTKNLRATTVTKYDAVGNVVQIVEPAGLTYDANGNANLAVAPSGYTTTRYYDASGNMLAEINADNALCEYQYNAAGEKVRKDQYMVRLAPSAQNPAVRPAAPSGSGDLAARTTLYEYDFAGHLTKTTLPTTQTYDLTFIGAEPSAYWDNNPITERHVYNFYDKEVETYDRDGNRSLSYYDAKGRKVASVDALGYLIEWKYDAQDNVIEERIYKTALANPASLSSATRPTPPAGEVYITTRQYDTASRLVREILPAVDTFDPNTQTTTRLTPTTDYTYDQSGNMTSKTVGVGTSVVVTTFYYYDSVNRLIATIDNAARVPKIYMRDQNGNVVNEVTMNWSIPYFWVGGGTIPLSTSRGPVDAFTMDNPNLPGFASADSRSTTTTFDALNRVTQEKQGGQNLDASGNPYTADDRITTSRYDAMGNRTYLKDPVGNVTETNYDMVGRVRETILPDGNTTLFEYDAAGNMTLAYIKPQSFTVAPPVNVTVSLTDQLTVNWQTSAIGQAGWVVWDTASRGSVDAYAHQAGSQVSNANGAMSAKLGDIAPGTTVFFRVVTQDPAGNMAWSDEKQTTIPSRLSWFKLLYDSYGERVPGALFNGPVSNVTLLYGNPGALTNSLAMIPTAAPHMVVEPNGTYIVDVNQLPDVSTIGAFAVRWTSGGVTYTSKEMTLKDPENVVTNASANQTAITVNGVSGYRLNITARVPSATATGFTGIEAQYRIAGSTELFSAARIVAGTSGSPNYTYAISIGDQAPLAAGTYEIVLYGVDGNGTRKALQTFKHVVSSATATSTYNGISYTLATSDASIYGEVQKLYINGGWEPAYKYGNRILLDITNDVAASSTVSYGIEYGPSSPYSYRLIPTQVTGSNPPVYRMRVELTLDPEVTNNLYLMNGETSPVGVSWSNEANGNSYGDVDLVAQGNGVYTATIPVDFQSTDKLRLNFWAHNAPVVWYYGEQWLFDTIRGAGMTQTATASGNALEWFWWERGGSITRDASGNYTVQQGTWVDAPFDATPPSGYSISLANTGQPAGTRDGTSAYAIKSRYNALDYKVWSNEGDGLFRNFYVNGNGYVLETDLLGIEGGSSGISTFTERDARGRVTREFKGVVTAPDGSITRPVTKYSYDVFDHVISRTDPGASTAWRYEYNALGALIKETDPLNYVTQHKVDQFGHETARISARNYTTLKFYDPLGNLIKERDPIGNEILYSRDAFGRVLQKRDGINWTHYYYDAFDQLTKVEQAQGWELGSNNATFYQNERVRLGYAADATTLTFDQTLQLRAKYAISYQYDKSGNRTRTISDKETIVQDYDSMGRIWRTQDTQNGRTATTEVKYDAYGNVYYQKDAEGREKNWVYGAFGRLLRDVDEDGDATAYDYDDYGRVIHEYDPDHTNNLDDPNAQRYKDIWKNYDNNGLLTGIRDAVYAFDEGDTTVYTYYLNGLRRTMTTNIGYGIRDMVYTYDAKGQLTRWVDNGSYSRGIHLNIDYDADGNRVRAYTDAGYDPLNKGGGNPNYRMTHNVYVYDAADRITDQFARTIASNGAVTDTLVSHFDYDAANNRKGWNDKSTNTQWTYTFDANNRVVDATAGTHKQVWTYDTAGNVLNYTETDNGKLRNSTDTQYTSTGSVVTTKKWLQDLLGSPMIEVTTTTNTIDRTGRTTKTVMQQHTDIGTSVGSTKTYTYRYTYYGDGREKSVTVDGKPDANSYSYYDANKNLVSVRQSEILFYGNPDYGSADVFEGSWFVFDNEGHILLKSHHYASQAPTDYSYYFYDGNANPVGEATGFYLDKEFILDAGRYSVVPNIDSKRPGANGSYVVREGDTLASIASLFYGNPSLWYVLADANGLDANTPLKDGMEITIPNTVKTGSITAANHAVYNESDIVGSTLPIILQPPKKKSKCAMIAAIIVTVILAIVVAVATYGAGTAASAAMVSAVGAAAGSAAAATVTVATFVVVGAAIAAVGSILRQSILVGIGEKDDINWGLKKGGVLGDSLVGAITGAAQGVGAAAQGAAAAGTLASATSSWAKVTSAALQTSAAAIGQKLEHGKVTSWTGLAAAAIGGYANAASSIAKGANAAVTSAVAKGSYQAANNVSIFAGAARSSGELWGKVNLASQALTPWVQLAESEARNNQLTPADWGSAAASTIGSALISGDEEQGEDAVTEYFKEAGIRVASNLVLAGAIAPFDKEAAFQQLANTVGQELGHLAGTFLQGQFSDLAQYMESKRSEQTIRQQWYRGKFLGAGDEDAGANYDVDVGDVKILDDGLGNPVAPLAPRPLYSVSPEELGLHIGKPGQFDLKLDESLFEPIYDVRTGDGAMKDGVDVQIDDAVLQEPLPDLAALWEEMKANTADNEFTDAGLQGLARSWSDKFGSPETAKAVNDRVLQYRLKPSIEKDIGVLSRAGGYQGKYILTQRDWERAWFGAPRTQWYDQKTNKATTSPFSFERFAKTIADDNNKHLNVLTLDAELWNEYTMNQRVPLGYEGSGQTSGQFGGLIGGAGWDARLGGERDESIYRANARMRGLSSVNPSDKGYGVTPDTLDLFFEIYRKNATVYATASGFAGFLDAKGNATLGVTGNVSASESAEALAEVGFRPSHGYVYATAMAEYVWEKYHGDAKLQMDTGLGTLSLQAGGDINIGAIGAQLGGGLKLTPNDGLRTFVEFGGSLGLGARTSFTLQFKPDLEKIKQLPRDLIQIQKETPPSPWSVMGSYY